jgi:hypothetical protein
MGTKKISFEKLKKDLEDNLVNKEFAENQSE